MFLVNSRLGRFCATPARSPSRVTAPTGVPLLPKLRGQVAEFLGEGSPVHLGSVLPAHLRRFAVRTRCPWLGAFLGGTGSQPSRWPSPRPLRRPSGLASADFPAAHTLRAARTMSIAWRARPPRVPPSLVTATARCRNIDLLSIAYALRPRLRPDYPWVDHPAPGTLGLAVARILTRFVATHTGIRTRHRSTRVSARASLLMTTLPYHAALRRHPRLRSVGLSPGTLSARDHWTSELLRTRSRVAASKPTSWLSGRSHLLVPLSPHLGTLAGGLGCFPLDDEA